MRRSCCCCAGCSRRRCPTSRRLYPKTTSRSSPETKPNVLRFVTYIRYEHPMKRALVVLAILASTASLRAAERQIVGGVQDHSAAQASDCDHFFTTTFTNFPAEANEQEQREISLAGVDQLKVIASNEGGVSIRGWNRPNARLIVCRTAVAESKMHAQQVLDAVSVSHRDGEITAKGPTTDGTQAWWANIILYVPRRAKLDVRAANGGVALRNLSGRVSAKTTNGGISVANSPGDFKIETESGGITLDRVSGRVEAISREGAIALKVDEAASVPTIEARAGGGGSIICNLTNDATWDPTRKMVRIGDGYPEVRLSTDSTIMIDRIR